MAGTTGEEPEEEEDNAASTTERKEEVCSLCTSPSPPVSSRLRSEPQGLFYILLCIFLKSSDICRAKPWFYAC